MLNEDPDTRKFTRGDVMIGVIAVLLLLYAFVTGACVISDQWRAAEPDVKQQDS